MKSPFIPKNIIGIILNNVTGKHGEFKPKREFYNTVEIKQKRFWQLVRGEVSPTTDEINAVAGYFKKSLGVDIPLVQLSLFDVTEDFIKAKK